VRIVVVTPYLPFPPDEGGRIGLFNALKYLSPRHDLFLISLLRRSDNNAAVDALRTYCAHIETVAPETTPDVLRTIVGLVTEPPMSLRKFWTADMHNRIRKCTERFNADLVDFEDLRTAHYRSAVVGRPTVLREHNVEYIVWERHARTAESLAEKGIAALGARRIRSFEASAAARFDRCIVVTPADAQHLRAIAPQASIEVIPSGVDTEVFYPLNGILEQRDTLTLVGSFSWRPKQLNLIRLVTSVFPRIRAAHPAARLRIVGRGLTAESAREVSRVSGVLIEGEVADVRPFIASSTVMLNYVHSGGGIALKVLEAMAMGKAVLANRLGCEGINARDDVELSIAEDDDDFVRKAVMLLGAAETRRRIGQEALELVRRDYAWTNLARRFDACFEAVVASHGAR
jgi:glycosyltransferase involved in cell wall biosynthesis